jgi:hypothetical protein
MDLICLLSLIAAKDCLKQETAYPREIPAHNKYQLTPYKANSPASALAKRPSQEEI